ncbi:ribonuclease T [Bowmanella yangjiangensis]|uniref:Ribonuclease T n=1 Tax=Bowmanella yangjiangensis TaxID=2811230 RepID=A0ABS3CX17_9ALTE|nr:ribonuclease T [Bowmanella yangjiangensis]MBN7820931.1 ribonuclease T [Bowmanella yangjiangensis]
MTAETQQLKQRFRGYFPVVIDVETAGFNPLTDALLEIAAVTLKLDGNGQLVRDKTIHFHVAPFEGANLEPAALEFNGIDPHCALRGALSETEVMKELCKQIRKAQKDADCQRSVIVAHNAAFDQGFVNAAINRSAIKRTPFHPFVSFDTTSLSALAFGQTVLIKACKAAGLAFDQAQAHSALYDAEQTADLFCIIVNKWQELGGWPPAIEQS